MHLAQTIGQYKGNGSLLMRIGFVSDAHGNPFGLKACLDSLRLAQVERVYFLGDSLGYFPDAVAVLDLLKTNKVHCLMGNHEAMVLGRLPLNPEAEPICRIEEARQCIGYTGMHEISSWSTMARIEVDRKRIVLMHGRPDAPLNGYLYPGFDLKVLNGCEADLLFVGHTHRPFISCARNLRIVNIGSVSLPRQGGGKASCAVYDTATDRLELQHVPLPIGQLLRHYQGMVHERVLETLER
jgi:putative phosphoesterase